MKPGVLPTSTKKCIDSPIISNYNSPDFGSELSSVGNEAFVKVLNVLDKLFPVKGKLFDVGCGRGKFLKLARDKNWEVCGLDFCDVMLDFVKREYGLNVCKGGVEEAVFKDKSYNVITMWDFIEHVNNPVKAIEAVSKRLGKNRMLVIATPNQKSLLAQLAAFVYCISFGLIKFPVNTLYFLTHSSYFSLDTLRFLFDKTGYKIENVLMDETDLRRLNLNAFMKMVVKTIFFFSKIFSMENRIIVFARRL